VPLGLDLDLAQIRPDFVDPVGGDTIAITVNPDNDLQPSGSVTMWVDSGSGYTAVPMANDGGGTYVGTFPAAGCGDIISYYFTADDTDGGTWSLPAAGASGAWSTLSATGIDFVVNEDFESDIGWGVQDISISTGTWERAVPGDFGRDDPSADADGSGRCFVTGNGNQDDVDGGPTMLDTPPLDLTTLNDPRVSYARWHVSNGNDPFTFQISSNGGSTFTTVETVNTSSGWNTVEFRVSDYATITDQMVFRFTSQDTPNDSITESGVDTFRIFDILCGSDCQADFTGDGALDFFDVSGFINAYNAQSPEADINGDGVFDFFDVSAYINLFSAGCP
jgi:hypothetical protein